MTPHEYIKWGAKFGVDIYEVDAKGNIYKNILIPFQY